MVPGAEPSVGQPRGSHLALQYPPGLVGFLSITIGLMKLHFSPLEVQYPGGICSSFAFKVTSQNMKLVRGTFPISCLN